MKMTKLLASGVAASLAATSLAAIGASAEERTYDMGYSKASFGTTATVTGKIADTIGKSADQTALQTVAISVEAAATFRINPSNTKEMVLTVTDKSGDADYYYQYIKADGSKESGYTKNLYDSNLQTAIGHTSVVVDADNNPVSVNLGNEWWEGATMTIEGYKIDDKGNKIKVTDNLKLQCAWVGDFGDQAFTLSVLPKSEPVYKEWEFAPHWYDEIEKVTMKYNYRMDTDNSYVYTILNNFKGDIRVNIGDVKVYNGGMNLNGGPKNDGTPVATYTNNIGTNRAQLDGELGDDYAAALIAYAVAHCGYSPSYEMFLGDQVGISSIDMYKNYDILKYTSVDDVIDRVHVKKLSETGAHASQSNARPDGNQSYNNDDMTQGDSPAGFSGFASQVANFFNKQTNGEITFKFTTVTADGGSAWVVGGIPSTEVGLKKVLDGANEQDFALFFNYATTGGVMLSAVKVDGASGTVTFDISDYLDTCDGLTSATLNNIYYGLTKNASLAYGDSDDDIGLKVESVSLSYGEDEDAGDIEEDDDDTDDTDDDDDTDDTDDVDDDDDTDDDDDDDEDDTGISIDDDDDDDDNDTQGAVVTPSNNEEPDGNPNTGVALAVVPAMVAAAAVVVSKKRK